MDLFDKIGKKISSTTQNVVRSTKDYTDIARLNSLIAEEKRQIESLYSQIGELYYESSQAGEENDEALNKLCLAVTSANERIAKHNEEIREIKGVKKCSDCGADIPLASVFCGVCGKKAEEQAETPEPSAAEKRFCTNCGAELSDGLAFCTTCGQKTE